MRRRVWYYSAGNIQSRSSIYKIADQIYVALKEGSLLAHW